MKKSFKVVIDVEMNVNELTMNDEKLNDYVKNEILLLLEDIDLNTLECFGLKRKKYSSIIEEVNEEKIYNIQKNIKIKIKDIEIKEK
ncbi:hypothetical protein [Tepidibacter thalassicus]|uniref:Uncharacterized protein n=1 Tax=Tepidibacter thalassicus DSM 15285 TaxID=1123350 RepID=A0A1M5SRE9_9FIRM|nr:hypothetical protein [Tepidibacter thalassicus]SHH41099.1 hypothetical protein SAMN02744040_01876 [Tepidibacter thalassicus DSM 15285]